ncbi:L-serine ammonia-lyase [Lysinibacter sp. HNR]|uniref:L-serine ammonia-lyase n=1 Tax=Lysinibacter sp. HNR TaxID=3031408 RepID=UPI0024351CF0|nr:L-serine ammonia-lyase [Lysinibacter sp. HNR]WGD37072.1 L-serine ammonia-lyase [Lysinibacter sp. HNR]
MTAVYVSALELFSIGIGPSSSHTVGPMRAAAAFIEELTPLGLLPGASRIVCRLHGSLAATGVGHGTPDAVIAGLRLLRPESCNPTEVHGQWALLEQGESVLTSGIRLTREDFVFEPFERSYGHPNSMTLQLWDETGRIFERTYLSIGGGFIARAGEEEKPQDSSRIPQARYSNASELLELTIDTSIAQVAFTDEVAFHGNDAAIAGLDAIWNAMESCIQTGLKGEGVLPGSLRVPRRAAGVIAQLQGKKGTTSSERLMAYALAVNEENAAGGRVVTAPTNGAAGVIPAVLYQYVTEHNAEPEKIREFLLTAAAIGSIIKANASISGAEAGCQGEIGSACSMAAAGLCAVLGGTPQQVENAAEIAIEHHLGLTCDPVGGLVQIPCIERNAIAASTAVTAARIALLGNGQHVVSLDTVIETMRQTGADMSSRYKETSQAGLAVNVVEC